MSDVTRFVPTHVRRKEDAGHVGQVKGGRGGVKANQQQNVSAAFAPGSQRQGKDDAYAEFMKEMEQMNAFWKIKKSDSLTEPPQLDVWGLFR